jgi:4-amino-4-deoxy-L-arabinose transferase-like glycosyltransferase
MAERQVLLWSCFILAVGVALRLYRLGQNSLWVDEYISLVTAQLPLAEIPAAALLVFQPPLYFWLVHLTIGVFGDSETALRLVSAVAGAATIPLAALLIRGLGESNRVAILGGALLAISPLHLWYSQEARPYALLVCLGLGSLLCLVRALRTGSALAWAGFAVLASFAILTHVVALVVPMVGWVWAFRRRRDASVMRSLLAATVVIVLITAPFGYQLAQAVFQAEGTGSPPRRLTGLEIPYTMFTYLVGYSFGPPVREIQDKGPFAAVLADPGQGALGAVALLTFTALFLRLRSEAAKNLALLCLLPLTAVWLASAVTGKAYNVRYTLPGLIGFAGLVALSISRLPKPRRSLATTLVAGLFLWADAQWFFSPRYWKEDSRSAVAWLRGKLPPGSRVAVAPGYQTGVLTYYARRSGADFVFDSLPEAASSLGSTLPEALLVTRLHHLPHWRELVRSLDPVAGIPPSPIELIGYRAFLAPR